MRETTAHIRIESAKDLDEIDALHTAAFADDPHSNHNEAAIVDALRDAGALTVSLVAERDGAVVGHIALSPVNFTDGTGGWYGLGPIAVLPSYQRRGVGTALMRAALARLRERDAAGCVLLGEPGFYRQFGFVSDAGPTLPGIPPGYFMALTLRGPTPQGEVRYHAAFGV